MLLGFSVFFLKILAGLFILSSDLSFHDAFWLDLDDIKTESQYAVKKVLDLF